MLASLPFTAFTDLLTTRLSQPLPGQSAQFQMAPLARRQPEMASVEAKTCREAGVMALFYPDAERQPQLLLTRRPDAMKKHAGQIAFPGGRREAHESLEEAALRETEEEVLIPAARIDVIGALSSLYIPPSNFCVHPFVGCIDFTPDLDVRTDEVAEAFGVRPHLLVDPTFRAVEPLLVGGQERMVPHFLFGGHKVWGATAMMMAELAAVLDPVVLEWESLI
jgi:8-oxo-dGTP pyrophosphatase MutT (NUDIX family)